MTTGSQLPRLALIGLSGYGRIHLQLARECRDRGEARIVAAAVINPTDEAENVEELRAHGCEIYSDYREMLDAQRGRIDLCLIPTGIHWHARMTIAALRAGANVLVEKPLAGSLAEARQVREVEGGIRRFVAVGFQDCYDPGTQWLAARLAAGAIGEVLSVKFLGVWPRPRSYFERNNWAGRLSVDGMPVMDSPLNNAFAHFVMLSLLFSGVAHSPEEPRLEGVELYRAHSIESFDTGVVAFRTHGGAKMWFGASHVSRSAVEPEIRIEGTKGRACWRYEKDAWIENADGREHRVVADQNISRRCMMAAVLRRLSDSAVPICDTAMASQHTALIAAIHASSRVITFPAESVAWEGSNGVASQVPSVTGLDAAMQRAYDTGQLLRDVGFAPPAWRA